MLFVMIGRDGPKGAELRKIHRPEHLEKLAPLVRAGRVRLAGPLTDGAGSLVVFEADSLEEAERIAREDPYSVHGVFEKVEVHPFKVVFPEEG